MFNWPFRKKKISEEEEQILEEEWYDRKSIFMDRILGKEHDIVMHALIPYDMGGALDLYYFPNGVKGTGIATKELSYACRDSSTNSVYSKYELVMFTRHELELDLAKDDNTPFGRAHSNINMILNYIAPYSAEAILNPCETCEFPADMEEVGGKCLIFDSYEPEGFKVAGGNFGMMLIIELFRNEMEFAMKNGGDVLLSILKDKCVYPYSDLDRRSVLS
jgi:hypothetical protein